MILKKLDEEYKGDDMYLSIITCKKPKTFWQKIKEFFKRVFKS